MGTSYQYRLLAYPPNVISPIIGPWSSERYTQGVCPWWCILAIVGVIFLLLLIGLLLFLAFLVRTGTLMCCTEDKMLSEVTTDKYDSEEESDEEFYNQGFQTPSSQTSSQGDLMDNAYAMRSSQREITRLQMDGFDTDSNDFYNGLNPQQNYPPYYSDNFY
ncbi:hypothetical protein Ciccas_013269 [Cichlidogyrus casuarinus]|uniref:Uncharacterized protein n=1 Tax=Cichlidogyrus casuarinus TaxID=1844966 RepID=A0ABD2PMC0_9PLAT